jgi:HlyD family secretion protein
VVLARHVELGDVVSAGKVLLVIAQTGPTELSVFPDEKNLGWLALGQKARASADAYADERFEASVSYIAPAVDPQRGTVEVRLGVASPPAYLLPDMTVSVNIEVARKPHVLFAPAESLRDVEASRAHAFVLHDGRVQARTLELGVRGESAVEVLSGLAEGELLITGGRAALEPGMRAHVVAAESGGS